jgi:hypothetical protein
MEKQYGQVIIYNTADGNTKLEVKFYEDTVWLSQNQIAQLFQTKKQNISYHINNILNENELNRNSVVKEFLTTALDGKKYLVQYYNLEMIIALGYRIKSNVATNFRKWATATLEEYMVKGFAINDDLLKRAGGGRYFKELLARIRDIRSSERVFWRQVLDIFATSIDYDPKLEVSQKFFKTVQNKMHWATHGHTAAEIIVERANAEKDFMGLTTFDGDYPTKEDAEIAKNYLSKDELDTLNRIVSLYLDFAELMAKEEKPMTMNDWIEQLDYFLKMSRKDILTGSGTVSHIKALEHARKEYNDFSKRILTNPNENEKLYFDKLQQLMLIDKKD